MKKIASTILIFTVCFFTITVKADQQEALNNIAAYMKFVMEKTGKQLNVRKDLSKIGYFNTGNYVLLNTTLYAGNTYLIIASGDSYAANINVEIFDANGNLLTRDEQTKRDAYVAVKPQWTNTYQIRISLAETAGGASGAYVAFFTSVF